MFANEQRWWYHIMVSVINSTELRVRLWLKGEGALTLSASSEAGDAAAAVAAVAALDAAKRKRLPADRSARPAAAAGKSGPRQPRSGAPERRAAAGLAQGGESGGGASPERPLAPRPRGPRRLPLLLPPQPATGDPAPCFQDTSPASRRVVAFCRIRRGVPAWVKPGVTPHLPASEPSPRVVGRRGSPRPPDSLGSRCRRPGRVDPGPVRGAARGSLPLQRPVSLGPFGGISFCA